MTQPAKHTPGPWVVNVDGHMIEAQLPNLRNEYEHICDLRGGIKGQINLGNAYLIAAAPSLKNVLEDSDTLLAALYQHVGTDLQARIVEQRKRNNDLLDAIEGI